MATAGDINVNRIQYLTKEDEDINYIRTIRLFLVIKKLNPLGLFSLKVCILPTAIL